MLNLQYYLHVSTSPSGASESAVDIHFVKLFCHTILYIRICVLSFIYLVSCFLSFILDLLDYIPWFKTIWFKLILLFIYIQQMDQTQVIFPVFDSTVQTISKYYIHTCFQSKFLQFCRNYRLYLLFICQHLEMK